MAIQHVIIRKARRPSMVWTSKIFHINYLLIGALGKIFINNIIVILFGLDALGNKIIAIEEGMEIIPLVMIFKLIKASTPLTPLRLASFLTMLG